MYNKNEYTTTAATTIIHQPEIWRLVGPHPARRPYTTVTIIYVMKRWGRHNVTIHADIWLQQMSKARNCRIPALLLWIADSEELMQIRVSPAKRLMLQETESFEGGCKPSRRLGTPSSQLWLKTYELKAPTNGHTKKNTSRVERGIIVVSAIMNVAQNLEFF